jgi:IS5 family transposase
MTTQLTFTDIEYKNRKKKTRKEEFFNQMERVIPWDEIISILSPYYYGDNGRRKHRGRKRIDLNKILRMYLIQNWFSLSDPATEQEIYDSYAMRTFVGINFDNKSEQTPDETCLCNFRHLLEKHKLGEKIEELVVNKLNNNGLIMRGGTIVDATIISSPQSTKNKNKSKDAEMASAKKGNNFYFGSKLHIGVDAGTGYIHSHTTTPANKHDVTETFNLIREDDNIITGDSGYLGIEKREEIQNNPILNPTTSNKQYEIVKRPSRLKKFKGFLGETITKFWEKKIEKPIIAKRQKVEYAFLVIKNIFKYKKNPYKGIKKTDNKNSIICALANIYMVAKAGRSLHPTG